jgi:hypothetical protein
MENYFPKELGRSIKEPRAYAKPLQIEAIKAIGSITTSHELPYFSFRAQESKLMLNR